MSKVICGITMSIDGYVAGPNMTEEKPFGDVSPLLLHRWQFDEPENNKEERAYLRSVAGAYIMGRNMYGPAGAEYDKSWKGWWGEEPPYHAPVFVLTHRPREPVVMKGGTTFNFVTDGIEVALQQAKEAAADKPVLIAGGANTVNQYLAAGLIDEFWLHIAPVTIGKGPKLFENVTDLSMEPIECRTTKLVTHIKYKKV
ncbi:MAG TPA: dihydrofolate reductase family protein [Candidatus Saccharimonadales bacterium]|jgi:dihydrofolate reductase|nr:dihydrofolate reductase family protein [Candidatus Saccharimonadales bacterium]